MRKHAQSEEEYSSLYNPAMAGKSLYDLVRAIDQDPALSYAARTQLLEQLAQATGNAPISTPLSALMFKGLGGLVGYLISQYFGMGALGRIAATLGGYGVGKALHGAMNQPPHPPGYEVIE